MIVINIKKVALNVFLLAINKLNLLIPFDRY